MTEQDLVGRMFKVVKPTKTFPRDFVVIKQWDRTMTVQSDADMYAITRVEFDRGLDVAFVETDGREK